MWPFSSDAVFNWRKQHGHMKEKRRSLFMAIDSPLCVCALGFVLINVSEDELNWISH